jgi:hypothetical protein
MVLVSRQDLMLFDTDDVDSGSALSALHLKDFGSRAQIKIVQLE